MLGNLLASFLMFIVGTGILIIWLADINNNPEIDMSNGFFRSRERMSGNIFWIHIIVEMITALMVLAGGLVVLFDEKELMFLVYFACGALFYTSFNSLSWAFAKKERYIYALPMLAGLFTAVIVPVLINL